MCETLRNTRSRGRSVVPAIRLRWRKLMRTRRSFFVSIFMSQLPASRYPLPAARFPLLPNSSILRWKRERGAGSWKLFRPCLAGLLLQHFACVADALLLVRIRLAQATNIRRDLADLLAIDASDRDVRLLV